MEAHDFIAFGQALYGRYGWKTELAENLGMTRQTIGRYADGSARIPERVSLAMRALKAAKDVESSK